MLGDGEMVADGVAVTTGVVGIIVTDGIGVTVKHADSQSACEVNWVPPHCANG